ncbi:pantoate--beta-alanine ligase [Alteribacillus iranensis]|uniref:Pantothenate synthetase n=1 Tax=Alteribacillus iranensis TaxID=930128 RepID=A0A1I1ZS05_9BACI|nr:pantoate--beta-alanine ligase [Alteribacillus iranensis]SFE34524.1 pantothenate synthetase [Alteribacillus iranensis]
MKYVTTKAELEAERLNWEKDGKTVGFVPTMGALHEGHLSLIRKARTENDMVIVSIFVNPLQFGPDEDYDAYPRTIDMDKALAEKEGTDVLFVPPVAEMYPQPPYNKVSVIKGTDVLCGKSRPGHFDGVATVVLKLFLLTRPNRAYFGQKDAQQVAVVKNMVNDFHLPVEVIASPTIREKDGLAMSSRNKNLTSEEREDATTLFSHLKIAEDRLRSGETNITELEAEMKRSLHNATSGTVDYLEILSFPSLTKELKDKQVIIAAALQFSKARLIDNIIIDI